MSLVWMVVREVHNDSDRPAAGGPPPLTVGMVVTKYEKLVLCARRHAPARGVGATTGKGALLDGLFKNSEGDLRKIRAWVVGDFCKSTHCCSQFCGRTALNPPRAVDMRS